MRGILHYRVALSAAVLFLLGNLAWSGCADPPSTEAAASGGDYFGEEPPGLEARIFAGGELTPDPLGEKNSFNLAFSPDGQEMFFSYYKGTEEHPEPAYEIKTFKKRGDRWVGPTTAAFAGEYSDVDITFSPDGHTIFFASDRHNPETADLDIYYATRERGGWSEPIHAGPEVNSMDGEVYPSISENGNLFFRSERPDGFGSADLYRAEWIDGRFTNVRNLGPQVNTEHHESNSVIAADESFILFVTNRPAHEGIYHIYVSFQVGDNVWTPAVGLGPEVNSDAGAGTPTLSPDGHYLFFKKRQGPERGLYWISTEIIQQIRERVLGPSKSPSSS